MLRLEEAPSLAVGDVGGVVAVLLAAASAPPRSAAAFCAVFFCCARLFNVMAVVAHGMRRESPSNTRTTSTSSEKSPAVSHTYWVPTVIYCRKELIELE